MVTDTPVAVAVAFVLIVTVVAFVHPMIVAPLGIPVPVTVLPMSAAVKPVADVRVALLFVVAPSVTVRLPKSTCANVMPDVAV
jgi:hypothetical protein